MPVTTGASEGVRLDVLLPQVLPIVLVFQAA